MVYYFTRLVTYEDMEVSGSQYRKHKYMIAIINIIF